MKKILHINDILLKLIYIDCYLLAKDNGAILYKENILDIIEKYKELNVKKEKPKDILNKTKFFLKELNLTDIKAKKLKAKKGDYFFEEVYEELRKEDILEAFYKQGLDPYLFVKTALMNTNSNKNAKFKFKGLQEIVELTIQEKDLLSNRKEEQTLEINKEIKITYSLNEEIAQGIEYIRYDSEKIFNIKKIKDAFTLYQEEEIKGIWKYLQELLISEGRTIKEASSQIAKLLKEEESLLIYEAINEIKKRKNTPPSIIGAIKYYINNKKENENIEKNVSFF